MWQWDGQRWIPTATQGRQSMPPRRSRAWIWWVAGGCALLLVIGIAGVVIGGASLVNQFQKGGFSCLPSDFPKYPGVSVINQRTNYGTGVAPGNTKDCQMTMSSNDDVATVSAFYSGQLNSGDWTIVSSDKTIGEIRFRRTSRPASVGVIDLLGRGQHTEIQIRFDS